MDSSQCGLDLHRIFEESSEKKSLQNFCQLATAGTKFPKVSTAGTKFPKVSPGGSADRVRFAPSVVVYLTINAERAST